jgi:hypothetical protein
MPPSRVRSTSHKVTNHRTGAVDPIAGAVFFVPLDIGLRATLPAGHHQWPSTTHARGQGGGTGDGVSPFAGAVGGVHVDL